MDEFTAKAESYKPTFVYISGPYSGLVDSIKGAIGPITLQGGSRSTAALSFSAAADYASSASAATGAMATFADCCLSAATASAAALHLCDG